MDNLTILFGIISIIGALGTLWGIYLFFKYRSITKFTVVILKTIALFDTIVKNIPGLKVIYQDIPIEPNIILIEAELLNTGTTDIKTGNDGISTIILI
jgi:hypothetical protein